MADGQERSARVLDPAYLAGVEGRPVDELREMHAECLELETEVSYVRRLAQARIDIVEAELDRRVRGGSIEELVESLPQILADPGPRGDPASSRLPMQLAPERESEWAPRLSEVETVLTDLVGLSEDQLREALDRLRVLEREVSDQRRALFAVIDRIDLLLAERLRSA
ncbi:MAG TPA: hypothetical protein VHS03_10545 [Gaiellaceae bacterium]|jgi:hypothetical protein|nr:hypothetical protein [Gaiellaceae bacterium]